MIFCDTSTIAKLYAPEAHSAAVRKVLESAPVVYASELVRVELIAVFHRRVRERVWTQMEFAAAARQFNHDDVAGFWTWLPLEPAVVNAAANVFLTLPPTVYLRSADCLHLVTANHHKFADIYTHDKHQATAAAALGLNPIAIT